MSHSSQSGQIERALVSCELGLKSVDNKILESLKILSTQVGNEKFYSASIILYLKSCLGNFRCDWKRFWQEISRESYPAIAKT